MSVSAGASLTEIERVYETRLDAFVRTAAAISGSLEAGRDAVHDAFVSAVRTRAAFRGAGTVEAWLWAAVVNSARRRRTRSRDVLEDPGADESADGTVGGFTDSLTEVRTAVALLPERQRLVVFLRYFADLEYEQIADVLGIRRGTVSATLHNAHATLRRALEEVETYGRA